MEQTWALMSLRRETAICVVDGEDKRVWQALPSHCSKRASLQTSCRRSAGSIYHAEGRSNGTESYVSLPDIPH